MSINKMTTVAGDPIDSGVIFDLEELCRVARIDRTLVIELVSYRVIKPIGHSETDWQFDHVCLKRTCLARNFYHDLEVNLPGVAILLEMVERIDELESELAKRG